MGLLIEWCCRSGKETVAKLKEKIDDLRDMNTTREASYNTNNTVFNNDDAIMTENNNNDNEGQQKSYLDDDLDEILAKIDC